MADAIARGGRELAVQREVNLTIKCHTAPSVLVGPITAEVRRSA